MKQLAGISLFLTRVLLCSMLALGCQVYLVARHPNWLLMVQEWIKQASVRVFNGIHMDSTYRVAYNLLNGDGILVHTVFVLLAFLALYLALAPARMLLRPRR
jgi:hypothetical protein